MLGHIRGDVRGDVLSGLGIPLNGPPTRVQTVGCLLLTPIRTRNSFAPGHLLDHSCGGSLTHLHPTMRTEEARPENLSWVPATKSSNVYLLGMPEWGVILSGVWLLNVLTS